MVGSSAPLGLSKARCMKCGLVFSAHLLSIFILFRPEILCRSVFHLWIGEIYKFKNIEGNWSTVFMAMFMLAVVSSSVSIIMPPCSVL